MASTRSSSFPTPGAKLARHPTPSVLSRRSFLKGSGLGLGAAWFSLRSRAQAAPDASPNLRAAIINGLLGELQQIRAYGKQDGRSGGEDMLVLGIHLFDLIRFLAGDPLWCSARVTVKGRDITRHDAHPATEDIGPVAGHEVEAQFALPSGVQATFTSRAGFRSQTGHWGLELIGSRTSARILADIFPSIHLLKPGTWASSGRTDQWQPWEGDPGRSASAAERSFTAANRRVVDDWLAAIHQRREPVCSGHAAMKALEMVMDVCQSALSGGRVAFPLSIRTHPLAPA